MKTHILSAILAAAVIGAFTGCETGPSIPYDPSLKPSDSPSDKIAVVSMMTAPARPVAHQGWKVVMRVRNLSHEKVQNVAYEFVYDGGATKFGSGTIPQINAGETVEVTSNQGEKLDSGMYRVEGRVFAEGLEPMYRDRMDNWKDISVNVAQ